MFRQIIDFARDVRDGQRNLANGPTPPTERSLVLPAIADDDFYAFPDLEKDQGTAGRLFYDALFLTNNSAVPIQVSYSTGSHEVISGQPFDLQLPSGTTQLRISAMDGAVAEGEIVCIVKMRRVDGRR